MDSTVPQGRGQQLRVDSRGPEAFESNQPGGAPSNQTWLAGNLLLLNRKSIQNWMYTS